MGLHETYEGNKIPTRTKWAYSSIGMFRDAAYALVSMFLVTFVQYTGVLTKGLNEADATTMFVASYGVITALIIGYRIFDGLNDPFMGVIIEKTHFKSGKYKPWIMIGGLTNTIVILALFLGPTVFSSWLYGWAYVVWFAVFYLLWGITFTMNDIAYWGMLPSLTSEERERTKITTIMTIFCSVGQFLVAGLLPVLSGSMGYGIYIWAAIIVGVLFAISQTLQFFLIKEHKRDLEAEKKYEAPKFRDMFKVLKSNDQLRIMTIVLFIYYLGSGILNTLGLNYFYFSVDYSNGSTIMTYFTVVYGLGMIISQFLFPLISGKINRNKLILLTGIGTVIGYALFFVYGLPIGNGNYLSMTPSLDIGYLIPLFIIGFFIFFCQGTFYMTLLIMMTNTIEYNEWKCGERKEAIIFSIRPLTTKVASALQQGVLYLFLMIAGLSTIISDIGSVQNNLIVETTELSGDALAQAQAAAVTSCNTILAKVESWQVIVYKIGVAVLPLILFVICVILIKKFYKIDEKMYASMCKEIEERKANNK